MPLLSRDGVIGLAVLLLATGVQGSEATIELAKFVRDGDAWQVAVTLRHADSGWEHYADGWRVVTKDGEVLGHRTLFHPHVNEQPFTRSHRITIPSNIKRVFVEAHDKESGWSSQRLAVQLDKPGGPGYQVRP